MTCKLTSESDKPLDMVVAKEYVNNLFTEGIVNVIF